MRALFLFRAHLVLEVFEVLIGDDLLLVLRLVGRRARHEGGRHQSSLASVLARPTPIVADAFAIDARADAQYSV